MDKKIVSKNSSGTKTLEMESAHGGWIENQLKSGVPQPAISIENADDGTYRFASSRTMRIASAISGIELKKLYRRKGDGVIGLFYSYKGEFDYATIQQLELMSELLTSCFNSDYEELFLDLVPTLVRPPVVKISIRHESIYLYVEVKFERDWTPTADFKEVE